MLKFKPVLEMHLMKATLLLLAVFQIGMYEFFFRLRISVLWLLI